MGEREIFGMAGPDSPYEFKEHIQQLDIGLLIAALRRCRFNQKKTAEYLGLTYHQLRGYLRKYELTDAGGACAAAD